MEGRRELATAGLMMNGIGAALLAASTQLGQTAAVDAIVWSYAAWRWVNDVIKHQALLPFWPFSRRLRMPDLRALRWIISHTFALNVLYGLSALFWLVRLLSTFY